MSNLIHPRPSYFLRPLHRRAWVILLMGFFTISTEEAAGQEQAQTTAAPPAKVTLALPQELMLKDSPVDPYCFFHLQNETTRHQPINLLDCRGDQIISDLQAEGGKQDYLVLNPLAVGVQFNYKDGIREGRPYFVSYTYLGILEGAMAVKVDVNSATPEQSQTVIISAVREGETIRFVKELVKSAAEYNLIETAALKNGKLTYFKRVTPYDLLTLANDNPIGLQPNREIKANIQVGVASFEDGKLSSVLMSGSGTEPEEVGRRFSQYQACFDRVYAELVRQRTTPPAPSASLSLAPEELRAFTGDFNKQCTQKAKSVQDVLAPGANYAQLCRETMLQKAVEYNVTPEKYISDNQPYLQECIAHYIKQAKEQHVP